MTWDEYQALHLKIAREVGATLNLRVEIAEPTDPCEFRPVAARRGCLSFFRRAKLRELTFAYYRNDNPAQLYFTHGGWADLNELNEFDVEIHRRQLEESLREVIEMIKQRGDQTGRP
jgi:hypothetical protein